MQIINNLRTDAFPGHEIVVYERGGRLVIVVNRDRCLARLTLPAPGEDDPTDVIVYEPLPASIGGR